MALLTWEEAQPYLHRPKPPQSVELDKWHYARTLAAIADVESSPHLSDEEKARRIGEHAFLLEMIEKHVGRFSSE